MNTCKNCKYYKAKEIEKLTNREAWLESGRNIPAVMEVVGVRKHGTCDEIVIDACDMSREDMDKQSCKIMTWDGSSYMSGAYVSEDFGCIKFAKAQS
jgi:hypothetical protein